MSFKAPYRCNRRRCRKRKSHPVGTVDFSEKCPGCGHYSMKLDKYRIKNDEKDRGLRCDCNGAKARAMDKYIDESGTGERLQILGPHREGQVGCQFHVEKTNHTASDPCPF